MLFDEYVKILKMFFTVSVLYCTALPSPLAVALTPAQADLVRLRRGDVLWEQPLVRRAVHVRGLVHLR